MSSKKFSETLTLIIFFFFFALGIFFYFFVFDDNSVFSSNGVFFDVMKSFGIKNEKLNVLVLGLDETSQSTDTMFVVNFDSNKKNINILSIPRDTKVKIYGINAKINSAYAKGNVDLAMETVSNMLNIPVTSYILFDTVAFREIVDHLDGVYMDIPADMDYDDPVQNLHIHLKKGYQLLDGKKAEQFIRYRHDYSSGDLDRMDVQREFMEQLISQKMNSQYISRLDDLIGIAYKYIKTNISLSDALKYARSLSKLGRKNINFMTLPGKPVQEDLWYYIYDPKETDSLLRNSFSGIFYSSPASQQYVLIPTSTDNTASTSSGNNTPAKTKIVTDGVAPEDGPKNTGAKTTAGGLAREP